MEHGHSECPASGETRTAGAVSPENHEVVSEPDAHGQDGVAGDAGGPAGAQEPVPQVPPPAQDQGDLGPLSADAEPGQPGPGHGARTQPEAETVGACSRPQELPQSPRARQPEPDFYCVKWIPWKGDRTPIITQSANGPCPLLAIMNILFLQWKVRGRCWGGRSFLTRLLEHPTLLLKPVNQNVPDYSPYFFSSNK